MKKFISIAGSVALLVATVFPAFAAGNSCINSTTGPFSTDYCTVTNTSSVSVNNVNNATVNNVVTATANSGGNSASYNTLGGSVTTGNASLTGTVSTVANVNTTTVTGGPAGSSNTGENQITGPMSDNRITIANLHAVNVSNVNNANVGNVVTAVSDSGNNDADYNTGPASVHTGNAGLAFTVNNHLNDSATGISAGAGGSVGNSGTNSTTGPFSTDYVTIANTTTAGVNNVNNLTLENVVTALSRSGLNSASYNTLGGSVGTGNAAGSVGIGNEGNINTTTVQMAMGGFSNNEVNEVTGPMSDNRTTLLNVFGIAVNNPNNSTVKNVDTDVADTGNNDADYNTGAGGVATGLSNLVKTILNHLNDSLTVIQ